MIVALAAMAAAIPVERIDCVGECRVVARIVDAAASAGPGETCRVDAVLDRFRVDRRTVLGLLGTVADGPVLVVRGGRADPIAAGLFCGPLPKVGSAAQQAALIDRMTEALAGPGVTALPGLSGALLGGIGRCGLRSRSTRCSG